MILAKKVRLCPSELQEEKLWQSVGTARFIYNWAIYRMYDAKYKNFYTRKVVIGGEI